MCMTHILGSLVKAPKHTSYEGKDADENILYIIRRSVWVLLPPLILLGAAVFIPTIIPLFAGGDITQILHSWEVAPGFATSVVIFWYLGCFFYLLQALIIWYFNVLVITNKKIIDLDVRGILYKNTSEASLRNVEDVTSTVTGTMGTVFNIGTVSFQTAAEEREFEFEFVDDPSKVRDIISDLVMEVKVERIFN